MTVLHATIERLKHNYCAYFKDDLDDEIGTVFGIGDTIYEVKKSLLESIEIVVEECQNNPEYILPEKLKGDFDVVFSMDMKSFLEYYSGILSKSGLQKVTGINQKQLGHYQSGLAKPRLKQRERMQEGLHRLGEELMSIQF